MEYYSAIKRNTFESVLIRWMNLEVITQSAEAEVTIFIYIYTLLMAIKAVMHCLAAQMVKNLTAMQETRVQSLGQEDPLE